MGGHIMMDMCEFIGSVVGVPLLLFVSYQRLWNVNRLYERKSIWSRGSKQQIKKRKVLRFEFCSQPDFSPMLNLPLLPLFSTVMPSSPTIPGSSSSSSSLLPFSSFPSAAKQKSAFAPVLRPQGSPSPACPASAGNSFRGSHPTHYLTPLSELTNAV